MEFRWGVKGVQGFWEASKDCPQTGRDLAFLLPANRSSLRNNVYPMSFQNIFRATSVHSTFLRVAIWLHFREVSVLLSLDFLKRS
jgi:hypothetical protein